MRTFFKQGLPARGGENPLTRGRANLEMVEVSQKEIKFGAWTERFGHHGGKKEGREGLG